MLRGPSRRDVPLHHGPTTRSRCNHALGPGPSLDAGCHGGSRRERVYRAYQLVTVPNTRTGMNVAVVVVGLAVAVAWLLVSAIG